MKPRDLLLKSKRDKLKLCHLSIERAKNEIQYARLHAVGSIEVDRLLQSADMLLIEACNEINLLDLELTKTKRPFKPSVLMPKNLLEKP